MNYAEKEKDMNIKIGIDVGNYDTKTQHTTTPSGYTEYSILPALESEYLKYKGKFYAPSVNRFAYVKDKKENNQALILSLFGIAKELLYNIKVQLGEEASEKDIQNALDKVYEVSIGVGLPVGDFTRDKDDLVKYYTDELGNGIINIEYTGYNIRFNLKKCLAFPQDILPVVANPQCEIAHKYKKYLIIGIGGQTVDVIPVLNSTPNAGNCVSLRMGVRRMFSDIIGKVETNFGSTIGEDTVEEVLLGEETIISEEIEVAIRQAAKDHTRKIINECVQRGFNFAENPVVFFGGGGLLLRPYLENNTQIQKSEFLTDVNGNAKFYAARVHD